MKWHLIRTAYFEKSSQALFLAPIKAAVELIKAQGIDKVFVTSHWRFGPHIDIAVYCEQVTFDNAVFPECAQLIEHWLDANPSTVELEEQAYEKLSQQLGMSELVLPPYLPLLANNSVTVARYEPNAALPIEAMQTSKEQFLAATTSLLFSLQAMKKSEPQAFFHTFLLMMIELADKFKSHGVERGYISFRSHAEFFLEQFDKSGVLRTQFEQLSKNYSESLQVYLRHILNKRQSALDLTKAQSEVLASWRTILADTFNDNLKVVKDNYQALVVDGESLSSTEQNFEKLATTIDQSLPTEIKRLDKDYNTGKVVNAAMDHEEGRELFRSADFMAYRNTVNFFYLLLPMLDVSPMQKFSLCHVISNAVEQVTGKTWHAVIPTTSGGQNEHA